MNNNLVSERALRDVFQTTSSINIGTAPPYPFGFKPDVRSSEKGKYFQTEPPKQGNLPQALFQKEWPWVNDRENKHSKKNIETSKQKLDQLKEKYELEKPAQQTQFDGPKYLYDINRSAVTPQCVRCKKDTYFCPHRTAYSTNNPHLDKVQLNPKNRQQHMDEDPQKMREESQQEENREQSPYNL